METLKTQEPILIFKHVFLQARGLGRRGCMNLGAVGRDLAAIWIIRQIKDSCRNWAVFLFLFFSGYVVNGSWIYSEASQHTHTPFHPSCPMHCQIRSIYNSCQGVQLPNVASSVVQRLSITTRFISSGVVLNSDMQALIVMVLRSRADWHYFGVRFHHMLTNSGCTIKSWFGSPLTTNSLSHRLLLPPPQIANTV